ncbi:MAG: radical SAM protein [Bacteroidales bacterium]
MSILFREIVFGPIVSRRLGVSLGINLLPLNGKLCNFDCIYCECGYNRDRRGDGRLATKEEVLSSLEERLKEHDLSIGEVDSITFSGNGEPTMHPQFGEIVEGTLKLRDLFASKAKVSVLTNGSRIGVEEVAEALLKVDNAIIKIDSPYRESIEILNRPQYRFSLERMERELERFKGLFVLQTLFVEGEVDGEEFSNASKQEVVEWYSLIDRVRPREIMIYTIDRETPAKGLRKISIERLEEIATPLRDRGYKVTVSG